MLSMLPSADDPEVKRLVNEWGFTTLTAQRHVAQRRSLVDKATREMSATVKAAVARFMTL